MAVCLSSASSSLFSRVAPLQPRNKAAAAHSQASHFFVCSCSSSSPPPDKHNSGLLHLFEHANEHLVKLALATAVAGLVAFSPTGDALAAKSGGRVGGQAFRSAPPPRADNSRRANIYVNPPSYGAPPLFGGYGSPYYGGWGLSPFSFFTPGPSIAVGVGGGFNLFGFLLIMLMFLSVFNFFRRRDDDDFYD